MADEHSRVQTLNLVSRILIVSGILLFIAGAFVVLFVNTAAGLLLGLVLMLGGALDLGISVFIFNTSKQAIAKNAESPGPPSNDVGK